MSHYREYSSILGCESAAHEGDETSRNICVTTQLCIPEDVNHQQNCCETLKSCVSLLVKWHSKCFCNDIPKQIHDVWHSHCWHYLVLWIDYWERNQCDLHRGSFGRTEEPHMGSSEAVCPDLERFSILPYAAPTLEEPSPPVQNHVSFVQQCSHNRVGQPLHKNLHETTASVIPGNDICVNSVATRVHTISLDVHGFVHHSIIRKENPTRCNSVSKFYFIFIWSSTYFGRHTAHHQEPKTALAAWFCICGGLLDV